MKVKLNQPGFILPSITLLCGICIGLLVDNIPYLSFKSELSLGEVANFILGVTVAIYIPFYLAKRIDNKRVEKNLLIEECETIVIVLHALQDYIEKPYLSQKVLAKSDSTQLLLKVRSISNRLDLLTKSISPYLEEEIVTQITKLLISNQTIFYNDLTINLRDKNPRITSDIYLKTEQNINQYLRNLSKLKILINNA